VIPHVVRSSGGRAGVEVNLVVYRHGERLMVVACRGVSLCGALGYWRRWGRGDVQPDVKGADVLAQRCAQVVFVACFRDDLSFVRLPDFAPYFCPAGHLRFLDALGLLLFGRVVDAGLLPPGGSGSCSNA